MLVSLTNGKVIEISLDLYLMMSDDELNYWSSQNMGEYIQNPFHGSILYNNREKLDDEDFENQEYEPDLTDIESFDLIYGREFNDEEDD